MKVSDKELWLSMTKARGNVGEAMKVIKRDYGVDIRRQSVQFRVDKNKKKLHDIKQLAVDKAEKNMVDLMDCETDQVRFNSTKFYLEKQAKDRGYGKEVEADKDANLLVGIKLVSVDDKRS